MIIEMQVYGTIQALMGAWREAIEEPIESIIYYEQDMRVRTEDGDVLYRLADSYETAFRTLQGTLWVGMYIDSSVPVCPKLLTYLRSRMRPVESL